MTNKELYEYLPTGRENAIKSDKAAALLHVNKRELRQKITDLRVSGYIICSDVKGYYKYKTREELAAYYRAEISRLKTASQILKHVRELLERMGYDFLKDTFRTDVQISFNVEGLEKH